MLEYDRRKSHEEDTAEQNEDDGGDDTNLGLTNVPLLQRQRGVREREVTGIPRSPDYTGLSHEHTASCPPAFHS